MSAYHLPAHGETGWDPELNDSLQYLKDTAEAAETPTGAQAKATAAQNAAVDAAATDASTKADAAQAAAISTAADDATTKTNGVQTSLNTHTANVSNPHAVTKSQVGLGNADNTSDASKPVSVAQQTALDAKLAAADLDSTGAALVPTDSGSALSVVLSETYGSAVIVTDPAYGAVGDDTADDTAAIQAAVNAVEAAGGGTVYFPIGTYKTTAGIVVTASNVVLRGHGDGGSVIHMVDLTSTLATVDIHGTSGTWISNVRVESLRLTSSYNNLDHIRLAYCNSWDVTACRIENANGCGIKAGINSFIGRITGCYITGNGSDGIQLGDIVNAISIVSTRIKSNTGYGVQCKASGGANTNYGISLAGCDIEGNGKQGLYVAGKVLGLSVTGCYFEHNTFNAPAGPNLHIASGTVAGVSITGNHFEGASVCTYGIKVDVGTNGLINGNNFQGHVTAPIFIAAGRSFWEVRHDNGGVAPAVRYYGNGINTLSPTVSLVNGAVGGREWLLAAGAVGSSETPFSIRDVTSGTTPFRILAGGAVYAATGLAVGNSAAATTPGSVVKKIEVFDAAGASLGFVPVYSTIT